MNYSKLVISWNSAQIDLGISVNPNFKLDGISKPIIHVDKFGSSKGTIVTPYNYLSIQEKRIIESSGYFFSQLFESYTNYDRNQYIDTLNDWGFYSNEPKFDWYNGQPWSK